MNTRLQALPSELRGLGSHGRRALHRVTLSVLQPGVDGPHEYAADGVARTKVSCNTAVRFKDSQDTC